MKNYLMHHGILGQKWGKRNGPPYPLKPSDHSAAEKRKAQLSNKSTKEPSQEEIQKKAKYIFEKYDRRDAAYDAHSAEYEKKLKEIENQKPKDNEWWVKVGPGKYDLRLSEKAYEYNKKVDALYDELRKKENKTWKKLDQEEKKYTKEILKSKEVYDRVKQLRSIDEQRNKLEDEIMNPAYEKAWQIYKKKYGDDGDAEYGFDHYTWRRGEPEYDKAYAEFTKKSKELTKQYGNLLAETGKLLVGEIGDQTHGNWGRTYKEDAEDFLNKLSDSFFYKDYFS